MSSRARQDILGPVIPDEPPRGSYAYLEEPGLFSLSGLDQLRLFIEGRAVSPPVHHLTGLAPIEAEEGASTWTMPASPWWQTGAGLFPGGALAFAADAALGGAIYTTLPKGFGLATSELSINFLRPATTESGRILARGRVIHASRRQGLSEVRVEDAGGRLLAHGTSRCVIRPLPFDPPDPPASLPPVHPHKQPDPDPYLRPVQGAVVPQKEWDATGGLDLVRLWM